MLVQGGIKLIVLNRFHIYLSYQVQMNKKRVTHWSTQEDLQYHFFLICIADQLVNNPNKASGFYGALSKIIPSRTKTQCRSHHQKMVGRFKGEQNKEKQELEEMNLKMFYRDHYALRMLGKEHLMNEIKNMLASKLKERLLKQEQFYQYLSRAEHNLEAINFDSVAYQRFLSLDQEMISQETQVKFEKKPNESNDINLKKQKKSEYISEILEEEIIPKNHEIKTEKDIQEDKLILYLGQLKLKSSISKYLEPFSSYQNNEIFNSDDQL